ncbi:MAG TPA: hypothetical protein DHU96_22060, partial [Actinobacteria bacterium]|nr:hypothetical protein [Actinomycetota bacterium]
MPDRPAPEKPGESIAIVGIASRFPDAAHPAEFLELFVSGRRAFRRLPPVRLDLAEYAGPVARAALIEGWHFDRAAFGVTDPAYRCADPAHWLALETAARALADGGFPGGQGLTRDRTGVIIGNTLTGDVSRASALRSRWPYVRRVLSTALAAGEIPPEAHAGVIEHAAAGFLAPFPTVSDDSLVGSLPGAIADRICGHFGFRGGGHAVDSAHSSSLLAIATACSALAAGDLDAAVAGGVDLSLDPFELSGLASAGVLAGDEMRIFDARPTGFWPGEGCGLVVLMRAADARKAGVPAYAEIAGWGVSSAGSPALTRPGSGSLLLAVRRAYQRAGIDPAAVQLIEGDGTGTGSGDLAELTSLAEIRAGASGLAALGSIKANIGHAKAAAGVAGLIKIALAIAAGVIPPTTGCVRPHPLIASEDARLRVLRRPEPWPEGPRLAGVSAVGPGGTSVHVVVRRDTRGGRRRRAPGAARLAGGSGPGSAQLAGVGGPRPADGGGLAKAGSPRPRPGGGGGGGSGHRHGNRLAATAPVPAPAGIPRIEAYTFSGPDRHTLARELSRIADLAPWLSDGELHDLAAHAGRLAGDPGPIRVALVAGTQDQLAGLARDAVALLPSLRPGRLKVAPDILAADGARGRVVLLFPGEDAPLGASASHAGPGEPGPGDPLLQPAIVAASLAGLRWLDQLGVAAVAAVGHGLGEITGLVWAGCLSDPDATRLVSQRAALLAAPPAQHTALVSVDTDAQTASALCAGTDLVIAADNGPRCQVLAGPADAVHDLTGRLAADGIPARVLGSPHALYTAALADRAAPMRTVLREFSFRPPARRLLSSVTGAEVSSGDDLAALLSTQLASPVRFASPLRLAAREADLLVETGPGGRLSLLAADCCEVPAVSLGTVWADEESAARVAAALFAVGAVKSLAPLFAGRVTRPIDIWRARVFITSPCGSVPPAGTAAAGRAPSAAAHQPGRAEPASPAPAPATRIPRHAAPGAPPAAGSQPAAPGVPATSPERGNGRAATAVPATSSPGPAHPGAATAAATQPPSHAEPGRPATAPEHSRSQTATPSAAASPGPACPAAPAAPTPASMPEGEPTASATGHPTPTAPPPATGHPTPTAPPPATGHPTPTAPPPATGHPTTRPSATGLPAPAARTPSSRQAATAGPAAIRATPAPAGPGPDVEGVAGWVRCFTEELLPAQPPATAGCEGPWRLRPAPRQAFGGMAADLFADDPGADQVLAIIGDPATPDGCATLLGAAQEAIELGLLVVITSSAGLSGFCATLHAEHPRVGVTLIRAPANLDGLRAARAYATATPGAFCEIVLDAAGIGRTPVMAVAEPAADGTFPLGPADVVLVSGMAGLGDLACAAALAGRASALAVIAPPGPEDPRLAAYLAQLRAAGTRVSRKKADPADPGQVAAAVRSLERGLGPVTAVVHAASAGPIEGCAALPESTMRAHVMTQRARLTTLLGAVAMERLRLLVTFGSVSARYGMPAGTCGALASGLLAEQASQLATGPRCQALHVDWAPWADQEPAPGAPPVAPGPGHIAPIPVSAGSQLLMRALTTPGFPGRFAIHGRVGVPAPAAVRAQAAAPRGRFLETIRVLYPGVELVADTRLTLASDPYLADHRIDGLPVLPLAMAAEAMAQAASALAGQPQLHLTEVAMPAPVVLPSDSGRGEAIIRVSALHRGETVETVLRCGETGFRVDHARAIFHGKPGLPTHPDASATPGSTGAS